MNVEKKFKAEFDVIITLTKEEASSLRVELGAISSGYLTKHKLWEQIRDILDAES